MRANWLCGRFCVQASSFENYIAEKAFTDRFVQQSHLKEYCQGYFYQHNQHWHVFLFSRLLQNPKYMNASIKFIN